MRNSHTGIAPSTSESRASEPRGGTSVRALSLASFAIFAWVVAVGMSMPPSEAVGLVPVGYVLANSAAFCSIVFDKRRGGLSLMVAFFFLFFVAVPASVQVSEGIFPFASTYNSAQIVHTYVLLAAAQIFLQLGVLIVNQRRPQTSSIGAGSAEPRRISYRFSWALILLCWAIIAYLGPRNLFTTRAELATDALASEGIQQQLLFVGRSLALLSLLIPLIEFRSISGVRREKGRAVVTIVVASFTALALNFPPALPRFQLLGVALSLLAILINLFSSQAKIWFSVGATAFLFFMFPAIKAIGDGRGVDLAAVFASDVKQYLLRVDFDAFKQVADTVIYLERSSFRMGENFLGVFLFWVPRSIWADKPIHTGELVSSSLGYTYTNVSSPLPAEAYISFGLFGLIAIMLLAGYVSGSVERSVTESSIRGAGGSILVLYALLIGYCTIILRGALNSVAPMFMTAFLVYALYATASTRRAITSVYRLEASGR